MLTAWLPVAVYLHLNVTRTALSHRQVLQVEDWPSE
jgi:hypothetical protein